MQKKSNSMSQCKNLILIACVDKNWGIGKDNKLLFTIKEDLAQFRVRTTNHPVIMGMNTFQSLPGKKPLAKRTNVVLTRTKIESNNDSLIYLNSMDEVLAYIDQSKDVCYCIGGSNVYKQLLPYCKTAIITYVNESKDADAYFPNLDLDDRFGLFAYETMTTKEYSGKVEQRIYVNKSYLKSHLCTIN